MAYTQTASGISSQLVYANECLDATGTWGIVPTVLVAGGDYLVFLGQSSQQAFIFIPAYAGGPAWVSAEITRERELSSVCPVIGRSSFFASPGTLQSMASAGSE